MHCHVRSEVAPRLKNLKLAIWKERSGPIRYSRVEFTEQEAGVVTSESGAFPANCFVFGFEVMREVVFTVEGTSDKLGYVYRPVLNKASVRMLRKKKKKSHSNKCSRVCALI